MRENFESPLMQQPVLKKPLLQPEEVKQDIPKPEQPDLYGLTNKLFELESRLKTLTIQQQAKPLIEEIKTIPSYENKSVMNIIDYSPEWDYTKGGAKVLICVQPLCAVPEALNSKLRVLFGDVDVSGYFLQPGVIKCFGN